MEELKVSHVSVAENELRKLIKRTQNLYREHQRKKWMCIEVYTRGNTVLRLEMRDMPDGSLCLQCSGILCASAERVYEINTDMNTESRKRWETSEFGGIEQLMRYSDKLRVVRANIHVNVPGVADREYLHALYMEHNERRKFYKIITHSCEWNNLEAQPNHERAQGWSFTRICPIDFGRCKIRVISHMRPGGWLPPATTKLFKRKLLEHIIQWEKAANE